LYSLKLNIIIATDTNGKAYGTIIIDN